MAIGDDSEPGEGTAGYAHSGDSLSHSGEGRLGGERIGKDNSGDGLGGDGSGPNDRAGNPNGGNDTNNDTNKAVTIVGDVVETVDVSKHPDPSIPESPLSLADIERSRFKPLQWALFGALVLTAIIAPYWLGRLLAVHRTVDIIRYLSLFSPQGLAFIAWTVTVVALSGLAVAIVESKGWVWRIIFVIGLAAEQFIAGVCLLKINFWFSTYVVYGHASGLANAANLGITAAGVGAAIFAVMFVGLLVLISKDSPLNVLTRSWAAFILFIVVEVISLLIVMFGGLLTAV